MKNQWRVFSKSVFLYLVVSFLFYFALWQPAGLMASAQPKRIEMSDNSDCASCHGDTKVLPEKHPITKGMTGKTCKTCHNEKQQSLTGKLPLSHFHLLSGISCSRCHGADSPFKPSTTNQCFSCHKSYREVATLTEGLAINPHESHFGDLECEQCHKAHRKSVLKCNECHDFDLKVP